MTDQPSELPGGIDYCFYSSNEPSTNKLLTDAIEHFGSLHCGVPDMLIMEFWRRITTLPADAWNRVSYGPLIVQLLSAHDAPAEFQGVTLKPDMVLCVRKSMFTVVDSVEVTETITASTGDVHGNSEAVPSA